MAEQLVPTETDEDFDEVEELDPEEHYLARLVRWPGSWYEPPELDAACVCGTWDEAHDALLDDLIDDFENDFDEGEYEDRMLERRYGL